MSSDGITAEILAVSSADLIKLSPVPVGRGFHWQSEGTFEYQGEMQISARRPGLEVINQLSFEDYLACVVTSEMGKDCPLEFAKAQMIAARSWAYVFMGTKHAGFDVCNDDDCQRYQGVTFLSDVAKQARDETFGQYLVDADGFVVPAYYAKTCGGMSETPDAMLGVTAPGMSPTADTADGTVWDLSSKAVFTDYLAGKHPEVFCSGYGMDEKDILRYLGAVDKGGILFRWQKSVEAQALAKNLLRLGHVRELRQVADITKIKRSVSGRDPTVNNLIYRWFECRPANTIRDTPGDEP